MNKTKKLLLGVLSCACVFSASMGFVSCKDAEKKEQANLTVLTSVIKYQVGDNLDLFDIFEYQAGQTYSFTYTIDGGDVETVEGETLYLNIGGIYEITATATKGSSVITKTATVNVYDKAPHIVLKTLEVDVELYDSKLPVAIINLASPIILSEAEHWEYVSEVAIYEDEENPTIVKIEEGVPAGDGFYDGRKFNFLYECDYKFTIVSETSGGSMAASLKVSATEDFSKLTELETELTFDKEACTLSWDAVENAARYRVKIGKAAVETEETSIDLREYLAEEFKFFDLVVVPKDEKGEKLGKMLIDDIVIAPEGSEGLVLGRGVKSIDSTTRTVTLKGEESPGPGWKSEISKFENSHVAFYGDYGVGYAIDVEFTGNNLPQLCFFANGTEEGDHGINGVMTSYGGSGWMVMNGLYCRTKDTSTSTTNVIGENVLLAWGPNRMSSEGNANAYANYITISEHSTNCHISKNTLFSQKALREDNSGRTYIYTARTYNSNGYLAFEVSLKDKATGEYVELPAKWASTMKVEDVKPGSIILYAGVKGLEDDTTFTYNKPYFVDGADQPQADYVVNGNFKASIGAVFNSDDSVTLPCLQTGGGVDVNTLRALNTAFVATDDTYGLGTYMDFYFTGNNLPQVMFFADNLNGDITQYGGKGVLLMNGLVQTDVYSKRMDEVLAFGPNRIRLGSTGSTAGYDLGVYLTKLQSTGNTNYPGDYPLLTQSGLKTTPDANYKYTVGMYEGDDGYLHIDIYLYNADDSSEIYHVDRKTTLLVADMPITEGYIVAYAAYKGENTTTTFKCSEPYKKQAEEILQSGATVNGDGSITLAGNQAPGGVRVEDLTNIVTSYYALKGNYGLGTYIDFTFTGNNMPQVMFFADNINGDITQNGGNGVLLMNGMARANASAIRPDQLIAFGPKRIKLGANTDAGYDLGSYLTMWRSDEHASYPGLYPLLSQKGLSETPNVNYKYTVGMYEDTDGYLHIDIYLYNADDNTEIYHADRKTSLLVADMPVTSGNIILYGGYKGADETTTFKYSAPYTKQ